MGTPEKKRDLGGVAQQVGISGSESSEEQQWLGFYALGYFIYGCRCWEQLPGI